MENDVVYLRGSRRHNADPRIDGVVAMRYLPIGLAMFFLAAIAYNGDVREILLALAIFICGVWTEKAKQ